jgi:hypothetical protein
MSICVKIDKTCYEIAIEYRLDASKKRVNALVFYKFKYIELRPVDNF